MSEPSTAQVPPCPVCASRDAVPIVYGYPGADLWEVQQRGEVVLGGCIVGPESPAYECAGCGAALPWLAPDGGAQ